MKKLLLAALAVALLAGPAYASITPPIGSPCGYTPPAGKGTGVPAQSPVPKP